MSDRRWRCAGCRKSRRLPKPPTFAAGLRSSRKQLKKLVRYFVLGVPAYRLRFEVSLSQPTIQRLYRRIREAIYAAALEEMGRQPLEGRLEADEALFGGSRHGKRGWGAAGKVMVFGIYERNGKVYSFPVESRGHGTLLPQLRQHTRVGSLYYTDDWCAYASLSVTGQHVVVTKDKGVPKGRDHLNGIEGFWSYAKHWLYQYRGVPRAYFHLYLKEVEFRFNHRDENLVPVVMRLLRRGTR
jgi:transposase